ncbi:MAG: mechanosensitive ion channel family protein [Gemmatimonadaceae bacterium]
MNFASIWTRIAGVLNAVLFHIRGQSVTLSALLVFLLLFAGAIWVSRLARIATQRALDKRPKVDRGTARVIARLVQYLVLVIGLAIAIENLGVNLAALFAAGAFLAVGIGIAMQGVTENFVAGISLLLERAIKPDDILMVDGRVVRVTQLGVRAAVARTRDEEDLIIPNSLLAQQIVTNYTLHDSLYRLRTTVGVAYESDVDLVFKVLYDVGLQSPDRDQAREPRVLLTDFGGSSIDFDLSIWIADSWGAPPAKSRLNHEVWRAFRDHGIVIAFPQLDVHLDRPHPASGGE